MKVLVWKSYGNIDVYDVSTPEKLREQIVTIIGCLDGYGLEKNIKLVQDHIEKHPDDHTELRRAFNTIKNSVGYDDDNFEYLFLTDLK